MPSNLLQRKRTHFVLWRPRETTPAPQLVIGQLVGGNPPDFAPAGTFDMTQVTGHPDLWEVPLADLGLIDGVYHYWFNVKDANAYRDDHPQIHCTDPTAWTVDWRLLAPAPAGFGIDDRDPAGVVKVRAGQLTPCDPAGEEPDFAGDPGIDTLPANNRIVLYELPTTWTRRETVDELGVSVASGTFRDVKAMITGIDPTPPFSGAPVLEAGLGHIRDLGINALELLPPADSFVDREWGYATSNYYAADYDLGFPAGHTSPTASADLSDLIKTCHQNGIRFFADMVMAFATRYSYQNINYLDFHVKLGSGDPEEFDGATGERRDAFGGDLFKYNFFTETYDPVSGGRGNIVPARQLMKSYLVRWMQDFRVDGLRLDSIKNIANWDFVEEFKELARAEYAQRAAEQGVPAATANARFLVVGEELAVPLGLIHQRRLDSLWNEKFKRYVRSAILGERNGEEPNFEETVRKMIDCRGFGFSDGAQAVNYLGSHDVEGFRNERLWNFLENNSLDNDQKERRIKLAFVCLLTAVGIPMICAGDEFGDEHDLGVGHPQKQVDHVNFDRRFEPQRNRIFEYVRRLVAFRKTADALTVNETRFLFVDFSADKRVLVWQRGRIGVEPPVVVIANFSDFGTHDAFNPASEYFVPNWPGTPDGQKWREVTQDRDVPPAKVAREPIFPWEAKVYTLVPA